MTLTDDIREALLRYQQDHGLTQRELATLLGTTGPTVSRWLSGAVTEVRRAQAARLQELLGLQASPPSLLPARRESGTIANTAALREYLLRGLRNRGCDLKTLAHIAGYDKPETLERLLAGSLPFYPAMLSGLLYALGLSFEQVPITPAERALLHSAYGSGWQTRDAPLLTLAHAAGARIVDGVLELPDYWEAEHVPVPTDGRRYVAFRAKGESMAPKIHDGDIVLCDLDEPVNDGQVVVAKFADQVVCKRLRREGPQVTLASDNHEAGEDFQVGADEVEWLLRAVRITTEL